VREDLVLADVDVLRPAGFWAGGAGVAVAAPVGGQIKEICLGSGLTQHVATGAHKPATEDQYAPVFVSSAITQLLCENMETLGQLSAYEPLVTFEQEQQKLKPYGVVWVNSDPLDPSGS
jgi:hypothetical protein